MKNVNEDDVIDFDDAGELDDGDDDATPLTMETYNAMMQETSPRLRRSC